MNDMSTPATTTAATGTTGTSNPGMDQLKSDLKAIVADAEALMRSSAASASASATQLRERLREARHDLRDLQANAVSRTRAAGHAADDYVHDKPWRSIAVAAGVGFLVGMIVGRR
ncbi:DUF883 family protein [Azohydromonas aeria]|uniref:DUF883 family protein n=1 Tax=Azohydromonas aeria TaxID=2590212 RepID=UPI0018E04F74|nr:DUF883 family protein [Azohydromonas aeria]